MRGPTRRTRAPIATGYGTPRIIKGKIISVDKVKHTVTVQGENNEVHEGIQFMPRYLNADGTGSFLTPEPNMLVWLCTPSSEFTPFILGCAAIPKQTDSDDAEDPNDFRMNRPVLNEGDEMLASRDSGYVIMRKGGMLEVAATQMARTFWIPVENLIQSFCENFVVDTPGGSMSMLIRDQDETWGAAQSPVEFKLNIKEFANDEFDIFDLRVGRIAAEDDLYIPIAGGTGQIVVRLVVNRHFVLNIDKDGNVLKTVHGTEVEQVLRSKYLTVRESFQQTVLGLTKVLSKDRYVELDGTDALRVTTNRSVKVGGTLSEEIGVGHSRVVKGAVTESLGSVSRVVAGDVREKVYGPSQETVGGGKNISAGEAISLSAGGVVTIDAGNKPPNLLGPAISIKSALGDVHIYTIEPTGNIVLSAGSPTVLASPARHVIKGTGAVVTSVGVSAAEVNLTGVQLRSGPGSITLGVNGAVSLGQLGGGCVVTTATHPVDYITGAPIFGISTVTANGIPGIGPIGVPPTPPFTPNVV